MCEKYLTLLVRKGALYSTGQARTCSHSYAAYRNRSKVWKPRRKIFHPVPEHSCSSVSLTLRYRDCFEFCEKLYRSTMTAGGDRNISQCRKLFVSPTPKRFSPPHGKRSLCQTLSWIRRRSLRRFVTVIVEMKWSSIWLTGPFLSPSSSLIEDERPSRPAMADQ